MDMQHLQIGQNEHRAWGRVMNAIKAAGLLGEGDDTAKFTDRSTPKRAWFADAHAWMRSGQPSTELETRFMQLYNDETCVEAMLDWFAQATDLRPYVLKDIARREAANRK